MSRTITVIKRRGRKLWTEVPLAVEQQFGLMEGDQIVWVIKRDEPPVAELWFSPIRELPKGTVELVVANEDGKPSWVERRKAADKA